MITIEQLRSTGQLLPFSDAELDVLLGATTARTFASGEVLCYQGRPATSCFIIVSGVVEVVKESDLVERVLNVMTAGSIAGQLALVARSPRTATLRAKTDVVALELTRDMFDRLRGASSPLAYRFQLEIAITTGRQLREANRRLSIVLEARGRRVSVAPAEPDEAERAALRQLQDAVSDPAVPFEPFDVVEITPPERVVGHGTPR